MGDSSTPATFSLGGVAVSNPLGSDTAGKAVSAVGGTVITEAGTVASGLTTVDQVVVSLQGPLLGTAAGKPQTVAGSATEGDVVINVYDALGAAAESGGTVHFIAYGTK